MEDRGTVGLPAVYHIITKLELGGAQQNTLFCARTHDRRKYRVGVAAGEGGILDDELRTMPGTDAVLLPCLKHPISPVWDIAALIRLAVLFRRKRVALVHTHSSKAGLLGRWAAWLARVPVRIHTIHGWSFNDYQPRWKRGLFKAFERATVPITHRFVAVAESDVRLGLKLGMGRPEQYTVIHSGMDLQAFCAARALDPGPKRAELGLDPARPVVGMVACFKAQKAPLDFVEAARLVARERPDVQFLMVGDGVLRPRVEERLSVYNMVYSVKLAGWRRDVAEMIRAMDILVLSSLWEGLPRVVPQAFCCGRPVVATAVNGTVEVVRDGENGFLVPPGDAPAMASRILKLLSEPSLLARMSETASRSIDISSDFNQEVMVRRLEQVYDELLAKVPAR